MKKNIIFMAALAIMATACSNEDDSLVTNPENDVKMITETIRATNSDSKGSTRADISDDATFAWSASDKIAVHVTDGYFHSATIASEAGTNEAVFTVSYPNGSKRDAFAVYPASIVAESAENYGQDGRPLYVTLPSSYTLAEVSGTASPCLMIAKNEAGSGWEFSQLCGLLRLTVSNLPPSAKRLEISFDGKKVCGDFSIDSPVTPGSSVIATTDDANNDVITITKDGTDVTLNNNAWIDGLVLNIPLPVGNYTSITIKAYDALTGGNEVFTKTRSFNYVASRKKGIKRTIPAVFTVNNNKQVVFAPGNLRATTTDYGTTWTWSFADNQYDNIGNATANNKINANGKVSVNGTVDSFGYSTAATYYGISNSTNSSDYSGDFVDWGTISTFSYRGTTTTYPSDYWRSLTAHNDNDRDCDWRLLRDTRTTRATVNGKSNARYTQARINTDGTGVNGIILFPDDFDGITPAGVEWGTINGTSAWGTKCTTAGWTALELAGCVFLPVNGGRRSGNTSWFDTDKGVYWPRMLTATSSCIRFASGEFYRNLNVSKYCGMAVRLVHQIN